MIDEFGTDLLDIEQKSGQTFISLAQCFGSTILYIQAREEFGTIGTMNQAVDIWIGFIEHFRQGRDLHGSMLHRLNPWAIKLDHLVHLVLNQPEPAPDPL